MKILVTGATGFIGQHLIIELLKTKNKIIATSIEDIEKLKNIKWINKVKYKKYDLKDELKNAYEFFDKPDKVIHLAWKGLPNYQELFHIEENLPDNYKFIKNLIINGLKDITVIGTCMEYGLQEGCLNEEICTNPITSYAIAKDSLRKFIELLNKKHNFKFRWVRLFYMYGKNQNKNSILSQLDLALENKDKEFKMSKGDQKRDYLNIKQVVKNIKDIALQNKIMGIINCCSGKPITIKDLVKNHLKKRNKKIKLNLGYYPYNKYEPLNFWGDNTKLKKVITNEM
jgi:nucleoside-diphosphate-sugar epimerase